jgi:hypothetical protein
MTPRRTPAKRRPERRLPARPHDVDLRHLSAADVEQTFRRATQGATTLMRSSMDDAVEAGKVVRRSMQDAFTAVTHAGRRIARRFATAARTLPPMRSAAPATKARRAVRAPAQA